MFTPSYPSGACQEGCFPDILLMNVFFGPPVACTVTGWLETTQSRRVLFTGRACAVISSRHVGWNCMAKYDTPVVCSVSRAMSCLFYVKIISEDPNQQRCHVAESSLLRINEETEYFVLWKLLLQSGLFFPHRAPWSLLRYRYIPFCNKRIRVVYLVNLPSSEISGNRSWGSCFDTGVLGPD